MELIQKTIRYNQEGKKTFDQFYLDEGYNVPDAKQDVRRIIKGQGTVKIEDVKLVENYVRISGKLYFQILYVTDQGEPMPAVLDGKIPFEEMVYTEGEERTQYFVRNIRVEFGTTLVHSRKISIRAMIEMEVGCETLIEEETAVDLESSASIYKKQKPVNLLKLHTAKKDTYRIKEEITIPGTKESIGQVLLTDITGRKLEVRAAQDELLLRGELQIFCMYLSEEGKTDWLEQSVPYEGRIECSGATEGMYYDVQHALEDTLADVRMDEDGEMRIIGIEGTVSVRINLYEEEELNLLEDLYSLEQKVSYQTREAVYEELLLQNQSKCKIVENLSLPELKDDVLQICHSSGSVQIEHVETRAEKQGGILIEGILHVSFLYLKADDALPFGNWQGMVPFSYLLECPDMPKDVRYQLSHRVEQISVTMTGSDSVEVKAVLDFDVFLRKEVPMQVITEVSLEETDREELAKKPGIVGYMVKSGDDLWTLAKQYMTTEESIRQTTISKMEKSNRAISFIICKEIGM